MFYLGLQVVQRFQELFSQTKYKEAAELAAESPQGILRTPDTVSKFQVLYTLLVSSIEALQTRFLFFFKVWFGMPVNVSEHIN